MKVFLPLTSPQCDPVLRCFVISRGLVITALTNVAVRLFGDSKKHQQQICTVSSRPQKKVIIVLLIVLFCIRVLGRGQCIVAESDVSEMQLLLSDSPVLGLPDVTTDTVCPSCYKVTIPVM